MKKRIKRRRKSKSNKIKWIAGIFWGIFSVSVILYIIAYFILRNRGSSPEEMLISYMDCIYEQEYDEMYGMIDMRMKKRKKSKQIVLGS